MVNAIYNRSKFKKTPEDFRIGAIISDGTWYTFSKWKEQAKVSDEILTEWIDDHLKDGSLIQSDFANKSYRFPLQSIKEWYYSNNLSLEDQLLDFNVPPHIWGDKTEAEGFLDAPLRELGTVTFECSPDIAKEVINRLKGIARVREISPNEYRTFCLDSILIKDIVKSVFEKYFPSEMIDISTRAASKKRELVDFSPEFIDGLLDFYKNFARGFIRRSMDTINIYLPEKEDQDTQIIIWIIAAVEKYNENNTVPFSGYLHSTIRHWPYDLPTEALGLELSNFQRDKAKAIKKIKSERQDIKEESISNILIAETMNMNLDDYVVFEEKNRTWIASKNATTLTWNENNDEKEIEHNIKQLDDQPEKDINLAHNISKSIIRATLDTEKFNDAFNVISEMDVSTINIAKIKKISDEFIKSLGNELGVF